MQRGLLQFFICTRIVRKIRRCNPLDYRAAQPNQRDSPGACSEGQRPGEAGAGGRRLDHPVLHHISEAGKRRLQAAERKSLPLDPAEKPLADSEHYRQRDLAFCPYAQRRRSPAEAGPHRYPVDQIVAGDHLPDPLGRSRGLHGLPVAKGRGLQESVIALGERKPMPRDECHCSLLRARRLATTDGKPCASASSHGLPGAKATQRGPNLMVLVGGTLDQSGHTGSVKRWPVGLLREEVQTLTRFAGESCVARAGAVATGRPVKREGIHPPSPAKECGRACITHARPARLVVRTPRRPRDYQDDDGWDETGTVAIKGITTLTMMNQDAATTMARTTVITIQKNTSDTPREGGLGFSVMTFPSRCSLAGLLGFPAPARSWCCAGPAKL